MRAPTIVSALVLLGVATLPGWAQTRTTLQLHPLESSS